MTATEHSHTNRELGLMLAGRKPFAMFAHERIAGFEKTDALAGQGFDAHVASGAFTEHVRTFTRRPLDGSPVEIDYHFYARPGEEWRVDACCLLLDLLHRGAWGPQLEWLQGKLLGYTDEQNMEHLSRMYGIGSIGEMSVPLRPPQTSGRQRSP